MKLGKAMVFKCASAAVRLGAVEVESGDAAMFMLGNLKNMVNVGAAECAVEADRERELGLIDVGECNAAVAQSLTAGMAAVLANVPEVDAYRCGEPEALRQLPPGRVQGTFKAACAAGLTEAAVELLGRGADLMDYYPLFIASCNGHSEMVKALLGAGADANQGALDRP